MKILGITGSLREKSLNTSLLREAAKFFPKDVEFEIVVPNFPLFTQDLEANPPKEVAEFKEKVRAADGILFACPEHNNSVPAVMKNAIEWANRPWGDNAWEGKKAAIVGAGVSAGTRLAQMTLRQIFVDIKVQTFVDPQFYLTQAKQYFDENANLTDEDTRQHIEKMVTALVEFVQKP